MKSRRIVCSRCSSVTSCSTSTAAEPSADPVCLAVNDNGAEDVWTRRVNRLLARIEAGKSADPAATLEFHDKEIKWDVTNVGDVGLEPETAYKLSASFDWHAKDRRWEIVATPYFTRVDDYIDAIPFYTDEQKARIREWTGDGLLRPSIGLARLILQLLLRKGPAPLLRLPRQGALFERHHPEQPHYHLLFIGCRQANQGKGIGSTLLKHGTRICDQAGMPGPPLRGWVTGTVSPASSATWMARRMPSTWWRRSSSSTLRTSRTKMPPSVSTARWAP